jgi:predicted MFS family arabinose efflux permease
MTQIATGKQFTRYQVLVIAFLSFIQFTVILSRMIPATALMTAVPEAVDRGAFMSVNASLQQISGGVASILAGAIVVQHSSSGPLEHYDILGYLCVGLMFLCIALLYSIHKHVEQKLGDPKVTTGNKEWEGQVSYEN